MYSYQNNKECENFLLYIFKHDISRKSAVQLLLFFVCKKNKNYNAVTRQNIPIRLLLFLLFDVNFFCFFVFFVLFLQNKFWCFYHFLWAFWLRRKCTFHGNIYTNDKRNPFSNKKYNLYVKKKNKKKYFNWLQEVIFPQFFSCFECKYVLIALVCGKIK